jgi:hypothetical protein
MLKTIEKLTKFAPSAIFTKSEAAKKANDILITIPDGESNEDFSEKINDIILYSADFDCEENQLDTLLDDVRFVTWDIIDAVIGAKLAELEAK